MDENTKIVLLAALNILSLAWTAYLAYRERVNKK